MRKIMRISAILLLPILLGGCLVETRYVYRKEVVVPENPDTPISLSYEDLLPPTKPIVAPLRLVEVDYDLWPYVAVQRPWIRVEYWPFTYSIVLYRTYPSLIYTDFIFLPYFPYYYFLDDPDYLETRYRVDLYVGGSIGSSPWGDTYICYPLGSSFSYSYHYDRSISYSVSNRTTKAQPRGDESLVRYKTREGESSVSPARVKEEIITPLQIPRSSLERQKSYERAKEITPSRTGEGKGYYSRYIEPSTSKGIEETARSKGSTSYSIGKSSGSREETKEPSPSARKYYEGKKRDTVSDKVSETGSLSSEEDTDDEDSKEVEKAKKYYYRKK